MPLGFQVYDIKTTQGEFCEPIAKTPKPTAKSINPNQEPKALEMLDVVWYKNHLYVAGGEPRSPWGHSYGKCLFQLLGGTPNCPLIINPPGPKVDSFRGRIWVIQRISILKAGWCHPESPKKTKPKLWIFAKGFQKGMWTFWVMSLKKKCFFFCWPQENQPPKITCKPSEGKFLFSTNTFRS